MAEKTKIAIVGYGNVGRGVNASIQNNPDMELTTVFTRRPKQLKESGELGDILILDSNKGTDLLSRRETVDVAVLCGGSKNDLPVQGPKFVEHFNTVDSFDTHAKIPDYENTMGYLARENGHVAVICAGWDPGTFSVERVYGNAFMPGLMPMMFYGLTEKGGLSMGHSDALRQIEGVKDARQYTHAKLEAIDAMRRGENPELSAGDRVWRECIVVAEEGADQEKLKGEIVSMPAYFEGYDTTVKFVSQEELVEMCAGAPHDGLVLTVAGLDHGRAQPPPHRSRLTFLDRHGFPRLQRLPARVG